MTRSEFVARKRLVHGPGAARRRVAHDGAAQRPVLARCGALPVPGRQRPYDGPSDLAAMLALSRGGGRRSGGGAGPVRADADGGRAHARAAAERPLPARGQRGGGARTADAGGVGAAGAAAVGAGPAARPLAWSGRRTNGDARSAPRGGRPIHDPPGAGGRQACLALGARCGRPRAGPGGAASPARGPWHPFGSEPARGPETRAAPAAFRAPERARRVITGRLARTGPVPDPATRALRAHRRHPFLQPDTAASAIMLPPGPSPSPTETRTSVRRARACRRPRRREAPRSVG